MSAVIYTEFSNLVSYRQKFNELNQNSLLKTGSQGWYSPTGSYELKPDDTVRNPETVHSCFETPKIEEEFLKMLDSKKRKGAKAAMEDCLQADMIAMQQQFYYVSENENAFRRRHVTIPKMLANRLGIKAITAYYAEEDLVRHVVENIIEAGTQGIRRKTA